MRRIRNQTLFVDDLNGDLVSSKPCKSSKPMIMKETDICDEERILALLSSGPTRFPREGRGQLTLLELTILLSTNVADATTDLLAICFVLEIRSGERC